MSHPHCCNVCANASILLFHVHLSPGNVRDFDILQYFQAGRSASLITNLGPQAAQPFIIINEHFVCTKKKKALIVILSVETQISLRSLLANLVCEVNLQSMQPEDPLRINKFHDISQASEATMKIHCITNILGSLISK